MIVIDTTIAVAFLRGEPRSISAIRSAQESTDSVAVSTVSLFELLNPIYHRKLDRQERILRTFIRQMRLLPLDSDAAEEAARIMGALLRIGKPVNALDVLIAGTAVANGAEKILSSDADYENIANVSNLKLQLVH